MAVAVEDMRRRNNRWRSTVSIALRALGVTDATARPASRRTSEEVFGNEPDVYGVPGVHVKASPISWGRVSTYVNMAVMAADERGAGDLPVLIIPRQDHEPTESYAIMRLCDFATLALDAAKGRSDTAEG